MCYPTTHFNEIRVETSVQFEASALYQEHNLTSEVLHLKQYITMSVNFASRKNLIEYI
jgi:hypothetical protein